MLIENVTVNVSIDNEAFEKNYKGGLHNFSELNLTIATGEMEGGKRMAMAMISFPVAFSDKTSREKAKIAQVIMPWALLRKILGSACAGIDDQGEIMPENDIGQIATELKKQDLDVSVTTYKDAMN